MGRWLTPLATWAVACIIIAQCEGLLLQDSPLPGRPDLFLPKGLSLGGSPSTDARTFVAFQLNQSLPLATLDYGHEVAGYPFFRIDYVSGPVQIEVKYSEEITGLSHDFSDGPFPFNVALANTYRVETFEITEPGDLSSFLLQGGQRWQSIRLITDGEVGFESAGFVPSVPVVDIDDLPGSFSCDDEELNEIWKLGARAAAVSCLEAGTQKTMWEIDPENGAYIRGMRPGVTTSGAFFANYTLEFEAKINKGGVGWVVAFPLASPMQGIQLNMVLDEQPFANFNETLLRRNSISLGFGYSLVNVTTLTSWHFDTFGMPFTPQADTWYTVKTALDGQNISVSLDGSQVFKVPLSNYPVKDPRYSNGVVSSKGSFGFGGWQDQAAYVRNVVVRDTRNGTELYRNPLTDASSDGPVREYGVRANGAPACLDGPKRDRLVWLGDLLHTVRISAASTSRPDLIQGTLRYLLDWQTSSGLLSYYPPIGYDPAIASYAFSRGGGQHFMGAVTYSIILVDYQILGLLSFTDYVRLSNDLEFAKETWNQWNANLDFLLASISPDTGLLSLFGAFLGPSQGGAAINCALVQALHEMADVAVALEEVETSKTFRGSASSLITAINNNLWNEAAGIYNDSPIQPGQFSISSMGFCITSGTASEEQADRFLSHLNSLKLGLGYKDSSTSDSSDPSTKLSPNTNGFLLPAVLSRHSTESANTAIDLIQSLWTPMISDVRTNSGASWEYVSQCGKPGLGLYTSLAHPWGGAPTYLLTEYVAGIQTAPGAEGFGYKRWVIYPQVGVDAGLRSASGKVATPYGSLEAEWHVDDYGIMKVSIQAPLDTQGSFRLGGISMELSGKTTYDIEFEWEKPE